jgi:hypothetical protein
MSAGDESGYRQLDHIARAGKHCVERIGEIRHDPRSLHGARSGITHGIAVTTVPHACLGF